MKVSYPVVRSVRWKDGRTSDEAPSPTDNVRLLPVITRQGLPADRILANAFGALHDVVIVGLDWDGEFYFASSVPDSGFVLWLLEKGKSELFRMEQRITEGDVS